MSQPFDQIDNRQLNTNAKKRRRDRPKLVHFYYIIMYNSDCPPIYSWTVAYVNHEIRIMNVPFQVLPKYGHHYEAFIIILSDL